MAGTYSCTTTVGTQSTTGTTTVVIYPQPTANFNFTSVCQGNPTQFTSTSTTNPTGQSIGSYQWNFGDESTGTGANPTHTYTNPGTYQVTLTVSTGNGHCTDQITKTVTVNALPTASFNATTVCQGQATQFTSTSTGQGISNY
jgi:PKD repeat protein